MTAAFQKRLESPPLDSPAGVGRQEPPGDAASAGTNVGQPEAWSGGVVVVPASSQYGCCEATVAFAAPGPSRCGCAPAMTRRAGLPSVQRRVPATARLLLSAARLTPRCHDELALPVRALGSVPRGEGTGS